MKKTLAILTLVLGFSLAGYAQSYSSAAGLRLGAYNAMGSYKVFLNEKVAVEAIAGFPYETFAINANALVQVHNPIQSVDNLAWYYGGGAGVTLGKPFGLYILGVVGLDYKIDGYPINLSLDVQPSIPLIGGKKVSIGLSSFAIRYILD